MKTKSPELLLPVKDFSGLKAALPYADAVYFGAKELTMRARKGFTLGEIKKVSKIAHENNIKAYLAVNTVIYENDFKKMEKIITTAHSSEIDALITWDPAAIDFARSIKIPFHISTQANISNSRTAQFYKNQGATRLVLARELSLKQISSIKKKAGIELETFIHGAMCVSISGRCYLSSYLYGQSANCGKCIQPCRKPWTLIDDENNKLVCEGKYLLNPKDLCMIEHIPELIKAKIDSFKVEGRLRSSDYVETVGRCYRKAIDSYMSGEYTLDLAQDLKKDLQKVYNRGFSTGFYFKKPGRSDFSYDASDSQATRTRKQIGIVTNYYPRAGVAAIRLVGGPLKLGDEITIEGKTTYIHQLVDSLEAGAKRLESAENNSHVGMKVEKKVRRNDWLYLITEK
ncbi:MAG: peptidase U32 family protein [archaeon]